MKKRKLIITHPLDDYLTNQIKSHIPEWDVIIAENSVDWEDHLFDAEIIAGWRNKFDQTKLLSNEKLRWVQTWSAGVNSLPLKDLAANKINITSANGVHSYPISETIYALMLGLTRKVHTYVRNQLTKTWDGSDIKLEMHNKTMGLFGVGAIGLETAKIAKAFGMKVIGIRHSGKSSQYVDEMYTPDKMNSILPECDYVVVTLPLTDDTYHLFQKEQFELMKSSAFFINIGRGEIVKEEDLVTALKEEEILGAGLDVFETEPLAATSPLWEFDNVIITPHTSGSTEHYNRRVIEDIFLPNLQSYLQNKELSINLVDYKKGY